MRWLRPLAFFNSSVCLDAFAAVPVSASAPRAVAAGPSGPMLLLVLALLLAACAIGFLLARWRFAAVAHAAREQRAALAALASDGQWETDAEQRVLQWQLPAGHGLARPGATLLAAFDAGDQTDELHRLVEAGQPFGPLTVRALANDSCWQLSGRPWFDLDGRWRGHVGVLQPAPRAAGGAATTDVAALDVVLDACDSAMLVVERSVDGVAWRVRHINPPARRLLDAGDAARADIVLPDALRSALGHLGAATPQTEVDGWRLTPLRQGGRECCVLTRAVDSADASEPAAFSYTVSHDLRAPIRVVEGFARIIKEDYGQVLDRVGNDHLDRVLGAAARMNQMIDAMLTLARLSSQPLARQPVNLSQLAGYVIDDLRRAHPEREVEVDIEPGLIVLGDPTLLRLVLENLIGNAWKYSGKRPLARIVFCREKRHDSSAFVVRDNGAGFDMRSVDRLFGLFQRLHSAGDFPGTGVGLASVRRIVRRHGGEIWADAEPGSGAAFHFTLGGTGS